MHAVTIGITRVEVLVLGDGCEERVLDVEWWPLGDVGLEPCNLTGVKSVRLVLAFFQNGAVVLTHAENPMKLFNSAVPG